MIKCKKCNKRISKTKAYYMWPHGKNFEGLPLCKTCAMVEKLIDPSRIHTYYEMFLRRQIVKNTLKMIKEGILLK